MSAPLTPRDEELLLRAVDEAGRGASGARPNPMVGAMLATPERIIATGYHARRGELHAERALLATVAGAVPADATMYVTLEPCGHHGRQPPCADALIERGVRRVVIGAADPNPVTAGVGPAALAAAGIDVVWATGAAADACVLADPGYHSRQVRARPWVHGKWAVTADWRVTTGDPDRRWISGEQSRLAVHAARAASGAVLVGIGTVLADDPQLTVRGAAADSMLAPPPIRVVVDRQLRLPASSRLVTSAGDAPVLVCCAADAPADAEARLAADGVMVYRSAASDADLLPDILAELARREVLHVYAEPGPVLAAALAHAGLLDEITVYRAPVPSAAAAAAAARGAAPVPGVVPVPGVAPARGVAPVPGVAPARGAAALPGFDADHPVRALLGDAAPAGAADLDTATSGADTVLHRRLTPPAVLRRR